jgi:predicted Zn-dependent protease
MQGKALAFQVRIINNPLLNAFTYPNGVIYVHTGILARMENEAQLATLLGHEMTHATHRHALQRQRSIANTSNLLTGFQVIMAPFGVVGQLATALGAIGGVAAVSGYSRELEEEADTQGFGLMVAAGYDPREAPKLFEFLKMDLEEQNSSEPFFFGTHPRLQERIDSYGRLLNKQYAGTAGEKGADRFGNHARWFVTDNAVLDLARGRFGVAEKCLQVLLKREPNNGVAHSLLGEVYRQRAKDGDYDKAKEQFLLAIQSDSNFPDPHKGLGLVLYKQGLAQAAAAELQKYLVLSPQASDKLYVERYIKELRGQ